MKEAGNELGYKKSRLDMGSYRWPYLVILKIQVCPAQPPLLPTAIPKPFQSAVWSLQSANIKHQSCDLPILTSQTR